MMETRSAACRLLQAVLALGCLGAGGALAAGPVGFRLPTGAQLADNDQFGCAVAIRGTTALATIYLDDLGDTADAGAAFLFVRDGGVWSRLEPKLSASDASANAQFGYSGVLDGPCDPLPCRAVLGAPGRGGVYVYRRVAGGWGDERLLTVPGVAADDEFGWSVAASDDLLVVGAPGTNAGIGAAYVFRRSGNDWTHEQTLAPEDATTSARFGSAVAVDEGTIAVGAPRDNDPATVSGSVWVYVPGSPWGLQAKLRNPDSTALAEFGSSLALAGNELVVGAPGDREHGEDAGAAHIFYRPGASWQTGPKLTAGQPGAEARFGASTALDGNRIVVGSPDEGNGGTAYVFERGPDTWGTTPTQALVPPDPRPGDRSSFGLAVDGSTAVVGAYLDDDDDRGLTDSGSTSVFELDGTDGQVADLRVDFDAPELDVEPGASFNFEVTAANDSDVDAADTVRVGFEFPESVEPVGCVCQPFGRARCNDPCEIGNLAPVLPGGEPRSSVTYTVEATASAGAGDSDLIRADISPEDSTPGNNHAELTLRFVVPPPVADLSIACVDPEPLWARPGETVTVGLRVANGGPDDVTGALVTASGLENCSPPAYCPGGGGFEVTLPAGGPPVSLTVTADVPSPGSLSESPVFTITAPLPDPEPADNETQECVQILQVLCEDEPDEAVPGEPIELNFSVENLGPSSLADTGVAVTPSIDLESEELTCDPPAPCPPAVLAAGVPVELTLSGDVPSGATGMLSIDVAITPPGAEPELFTVCATELIPMFDDPEVGCELEEPVVAGKPVEVTVSIENPGPSDLADTSVAMTPNIDLESEELTCDPLEPCPPEVLVAGVPVELTFAGGVPSSETGMFFVDVAITSSEGEEVFSDDLCMTPIVQEFDPVVGCDLERSVVAGEPVAVTISIENAGPSDLTDVDIEVTPNIDLGSEGLTCDPPGPCPPEVLAAGVPVELTLTGGVACSATGLFSVDVVITPPGGEEMRFASLCPTDILRFGDPIVGCDLGESVVPGESVAVTVSLENPGPCDLADAVIAVTPNIDLESEDLTCDTPGPCPPEVLAAGVPVELVLTGDVPSSETGPFFVDVAITPPGGEEMRFEGLCPSELTPKIDLSITCEHPRSARPGETVDFRLGVANAGPSDASGARLTASDLEACVPGALCLGGISRALVAGESLILTPRGRILAEALPRFRLDPPAGVLELDPTDNVIPCPPVLTPRVPALSDLGGVFLAVLLLAALTAATWRRIGGAR